MNGPSLIPRALLFGVPARFGYQISPDGQWLSWHAPIDGIPNLWIAPREAPDQGRPVTADRGRGISSHSWSFDNRHICYTQDRDGNENSQVHVLDIETGLARALTNNHDAQFAIRGGSRLRPGEIVVASNERDRRFHDLYIYDLASGDRTLLARNDGFAFIVFDDDFAPYLASRSLADGSREFCRPNGHGDWQLWITIPVEDAATSGPLMLSADKQTLYFLDSRGREASALTAIDMASGDVAVLAEDPRGPVGVVLTDIDSYRPLAWSITIERREVHALDERACVDLDRFAANGWQDWTVGGRSLDDRWWVVGTGSDVDPGSVHLYDRISGSFEKLADVRPDLGGISLARMHPFTIPARDGLPLVGYLTLPPEADVTAADGAPRTTGPLPMVLQVHGGPAMRDTFGFNPVHQWLANRGYAVLSVNFRGSAGFGKALLAAGNGEWGARMSDDLDDAVAWAVTLGIADPARVAISGASYGGYAVLAALTRTPDAYACGVDLVGPSNLETLMHAIPPHWESERASLYLKVGNPHDPEGLARLRERSPLNFADRIIRPLLIGQGANDPRVLKAEADQMVEAMVANDIPVTYLLFPDEGHGFGRPANAVAFNGVTEAFLARTLGGHCEPLTDTEVAGARMDIVEGEEWLNDILPPTLRKLAVEV